MNLWSKLKPQSFLGHRTARIILGFNHHQKIVNMLLSTRQTRRWAFSVRSMDVIGIQCNFKFLLGRWTLINMTCVEDEWTDSWTSTSRLDRIVRMTKPEERQIVEYIVIYVRKASRYWCSLVSPLAGILIYEIFFSVFIQAKGGRPCVRSTRRIWPWNWCHQTTKTTQLWAYGIRWCGGTTPWVAW